MTPVPDSDAEQVVLLSDRGPVRFTSAGDGVVPERQSGSVTVLLDGIAATASYPVVWLSPSTSTADDLAMRSGLFDRLSARLGYSAQVVLVDEQDYRGYYFDAGVNVIWAAWHGVEDDLPVRYDRHRPLASLASYCRVNQAMADRVAEVAAANAVVAVQDYQFMLAPAMIRARRPDLRIVHFSHIPFASPESVDRLPPAITTALVTGMLGADLLGFQRPQWARRFLRHCQRAGLEVDPEHGWVRHRGRRVWVRCYPVPVDAAVLADRSATPEVQRWAASTAAADRVARIVRVDRLDPAKNALRGFQAYQLLLRRRPELARETRFVACLIPSREGVPDYRRYAARVRQVVDDINDHHPGAVTVHYGNDQDRAFGVLCGYDVLLVNPVADGMNLVAMEGPVLNTKDGVVLLSAMAGAADLLSGAVDLAEPRDVEATAAALEMALGLSAAERAARARRLTAAISRLSPAGWLDRKIADTVAVSAGAAPSSPPPTVA
jgi:trehalose 6-phosphate synthase